MHNEISQVTFWSNIFLESQKHDRKSDLGVFLDMRAAKNPRLKGYYYLNLTVNILSDSSFSLDFEVRVFSDGFLEMTPEYQFSRGSTYAENDGLGRFTPSMNYIPSIRNQYKVVPNPYLITSPWKLELSLGSRIH